MGTSNGVEPDTKDWTWVLRRPCPDCGFAASAVVREEIGARVRENAAVWAAVLEDQAATRRPAPGTWSVSEYACHVRDVHGVFGERLALMLSEDRPRFPNWDQDATAVGARYDLQEPGTVRAELLAAARTVAAAYDAVPAAGWARSGVRTNGSEFTVETLGQYHLHDLVHHVWDVRDAVRRSGPVPAPGAGGDPAGGARPPRR
ncbi:DinB family protein [Nocardioides sp. SYSU DS0663]|uniref:DinB family protein n=1 Tax=Nocardioides sp. SYSU DS0663 TaxID=3416445 RepID=UPI003F4C1077